MNDFFDTLHPFMLWSAPGQWVGTRRSIHLIQFCFFDGRCKLITLPLHHIGIKENTLQCALFGNVPCSMKQTNAELQTRYWPMPRDWNVWIIEQLKRWKMIKNPKCINQFFSELMDEILHLWWSRSYITCGFMRDFQIILNMLFTNNNQCRISAINRNILKLRFGLDAQHLFEAEDSIHRFWMPKPAPPCHGEQIYSSRIIVVITWSILSWYHYCIAINLGSFIQTINAPPLQGPQATFRKTGQGIRTRSRSSPFVEPKAWLDGAMR